MYEKKKNNARFQENLTDITEIFLCSRQCPHQIELAFKFVLKTLIELFWLCLEQHILLLNPVDGTTEMA